MPVTRSVWLLTLLFAIPHLSHAARAAVEPDAMETPDVVVTATRVAVSRGAVPAPVTVLTREDIQKTPFRDGYQADDVLRYVPDVQPSNLSSRYNHPTAQAVSLRGLGSRRSLVLLDGIPLNDGFGGWINWGLVPDTLERIEVVPGGGSNLYGTWAMGGVIHLLTQPAGPGRTVRAATRAGNLNTYSNALQAAYGNDRMGMTLGARWFHTNGFITVPEYQRGAIDRTDDSRHENINGSFRAALDSRTVMTISGNLFHEDRNFGTPLSLASRTIGTVTAGLDGATRRGDRWEAKLFAQWQTFRNLTAQVVPAPLIRAAELRDRIQTIPSNDFGGAGQWSVDVNERHRLVIGADARAILAQSEELLFTPTGPSGRTLAEGKQVGGGLFGEWMATPAGGLTVIPSIRLDWWRNFGARIESQNGTVTVPRDNVETALNPKLAVQYAVTSRMRLGASFYQAFRAPTLNELYRGFAFGGFSFLPNESLVPERLIGGDAKAEIDLLPDRKLTVRLVGHHDEVKDQILFISQTPLSARRQNVARTTTDGGDVSIAARPFAHVALTVGYAYAHSVISRFATDSSRVGKRVPNVSPHQVTMAVTAGNPAVAEVTIMGRYLSRQYADDLNTQPVADFVVLDASIQRAFGEHWRLTLDIENLTNRQYIATQTGPVKTLGAPFLILAGVRAEY